MNPAAATIPPIVGDRGMHIRFARIETRNVARIGSGITLEKYKPPVVANKTPTVAHWNGELQNTNSVPFAHLKGCMAAINPNPRVMAAYKSESRLVRLYSCTVNTNINTNSIGMISRGRATASIENSFVMV